MPLRSPAGFISAFFDPLKNPNAPTSPAATAGDSSASVSFTAPGNVGGSAITAYYAVSNPGQFTGTAATSPVSVTGLTNGTAYTFNVWALNSYGPGVWSAATGSVTPAAVRGLFAGLNGSPNNTIQYITIATTGNAATFGELSVTGYSPGACASTTRGCVSVAGSITYVTIATTGNSTTFGNQSVSRTALAGCNSNTRGVFGGGESGSFSNVIDYITIATTGNATDFGDLTISKNSLGACSSPTRGVFGGGGYPGTTVMGYVTISSAGNATSFGSLTVARYTLAGCGSSTRGVFGGGGSSGIGNVIDYITIATTGDATDFGDLYVQVEGGAACSSSTRGVWGGSYGPNSAVMQYITIDTTGNSTNFGDLIQAGGYRAGLSNGNGGVQ